MQVYINFTEFKMVVLPANVSHMIDSVKDLITAKGIRNLVD